MSHPAHVIVIVMGDIGRSPRMQYHSLSLLEHKYRVTLIGYSGEDLIPELSKYDGEGLRVIRVNPSKFNNITIKPLRLVLRLMALIWVLIDALFRRSSNFFVSVDAILVQNPPSIPLLIMCWIYVNTRMGSFWRRPAFMIDWHNLGFTMFELSESHPVTLIVKLYEKAMAPLSDLNFCVSSAMETWLRLNFSISCTLLRDRPPDFFQSSSLTKQHECFQRLKSSFHDCSRIFGIDINSDSDTLVTKKLSNGDIVLRNDRPKILVSSTSWTPDEDFSVMLDALILLEKRIANLESVEKPRVLAIVTGKGPQKDYYESKIALLKNSMKNVYIMTMWLEAADYPTMIGSADIGLSLHTSTSGIDLPMKVLDFFGGGMPVCARRFGCVNELVQHRMNGLVFETSEELSDQIFQLLTDDFLFCKLKSGVQGMSRWRQNWDEHAAPVIRQVVATPPFLSWFMLTMRLCFIMIISLTGFRLLTSP